MGIDRIRDKAAIYITLFFLELALQTVQNTKKAKVKYYIQHIKAQPVNEVLDVNNLKR